MINFQAKLRKTGLRTLPAPGSAHQLTCLEDSKNETMKSPENLEGALSATSASNMPSVEPAYLDKDTIESESILLDVPSPPLNREVLPHNILFLYSNLNSHVPIVSFFRIRFSSLTVYFGPPILIVVF